MNYPNDIGKAKLVSNGRNKLNFCMYCLVPLNGFHKSPVSLPGIETFYEANQKEAGQDTPSYMVGRWISPHLHQPEEKTKTLSTIEILEREWAEMEEEKERERDLMFALIREYISTFYTFYGEMATIIKLLLY